jgi:two-component system, OmpR family, sensor histidine kinase KdpD
LRVGTGLPLVRIDFILMQQALSNLLLNVVAHTPPKTPVTIEVKVEQTAMVLAVSDLGPGLPNETLPFIFDKFYRGPTAPAGGTGLGLAIVKGFVEAQGGEVQAENQPGGGARFTIRIPLGKPPLLQQEELA